MLERMRIKIVSTTLQMQLQLRCVHRKRAISQLFLFNQGYGLGNVVRFRSLSPGGQPRRIHRNFECENS